MLVELESNGGRDPRECDGCGGCDCACPVEEFEVVQIDLAALRMMDDWVNGEERGLTPEVVTIQRYDEWLRELKAEVARLGAAQ